MVDVLTQEDRWGKQNNYNNKKRKNKVFKLEKVKIFNNSKGEPECMQVSLRKQGTSVSARLQYLSCSEHWENGSVQEVSQCLIKIKDCTWGSSDDSFSLNSMLPFQTRALQPIKYFSREWCITQFSVMSDSLRQYSPWNSMDNTVHGIVQARILEWVTIPLL